jgi:MFS family permease
MPSRHRFHLILFVASFCLSLASGIVNYALIFYVRDLFGADKTAIGLISAGLDAAYLAGILIFLRWNRPHPRFILWLASWSMALCIGVYLLLPAWTLTFVFHCLFGLAMALFWPRIMGWLSWGVEGKDLGRIMGRFNFSWAFGGILAPFLGGLLVEGNPQWPFFTAMGLLVVTGLLMPLGAKVFPELKMRQAPAPEPEAEPVPGLQGPTPLRHPARLGVAGAYFLTGALLFIFPAYAKESLGFSESLTGSLLLVRLAVATLGFSLWGRWTFWHFRFGPLAVGMATLLGLIVLFPFGNQVWQFYLLFAGVGLVFSFLYSYALFHGVAGSAHRERSMTIHEAVLNVGLFLGTALGGWISQTWSMAVAFGLCAAVTLGLLAAQSIQFRVGRARASS